MPLPFLIGGLAMAAGAGINAISQHFTNKKNVEHQQSINNQNVAEQRLANQQNEALTREAWARDDNAVQRRVQDLRAAGLSPTLAAGSPAGVSAPVKMGASQGHAPHEEAPQWGDMVTGALQGIQMAADYSMTRAQTQLLESQQEAYKAQARYQNAQAANVEEYGSRDWDARIQNMSTRTQIDRYNFEKARDMGIRTDVNPRIVGEISQLINFLEKNGVDSNSVRQNLTGIINRSIEQMERTVGTAATVFDFTSTLFENIQAAPRNLIDMVKGFFTR